MRATNRWTCDACDREVDNEHNVMVHLRSAHLMGASVEDHAAAGTCQHCYRAVVDKEAHYGVCANMVRARRTPPDSRQEDDALVGAQEHGVDGASEAVNDGESGRYEPPVNEEAREATMSLSDLCLALTKFGAVSMPSLGELDKRVDEKSALWTAPNQKHSFNTLAHEALLSSRQRRMVMQHFGQHFKFCATCERDAPCPHRPAQESLSPDMLLDIPLVVESAMPDNVVVSAHVLPVKAVLAGMLEDQRFVDSIATQPPVDSGGHRRTFVESEFFAEVVQHVPGGCTPIMWRLFTDGVNPVALGQRSVWPVYASVANSTLGVLETTRVVAFIPTLKDNPRLKGASAGLLRELKAWIFHYVLRAVCRSGSMYADQPSLAMLCADNRSIVTYNMLVQHVCDTKDALRALQHAYDASGRSKSCAVLCMRCGATSCIEPNGERLPYALAETRARVLRTHLEAIAQHRHGTVGPAKRAIKASSLHALVGYTHGLRHFDASVSVLLCSLHLQDLQVGSFMLLVVGKSVALHRAAAGRRGPGAPGLQLRPHDYVRHLNARLIAMGVTTEEVFSQSGDVQLSRKTGRDLSCIVEALPFALYGVLPDDRSDVVEMLLRWRHACSLWDCKNPTVESLAELDAALVLWYDAK